MNDDSIRIDLKQNKNLSAILYVLSEVPSYIDELATELNISKDEVKKWIGYLKKHRLIQELDVSNCKSEEFYPLILKKLKTMTAGLSDDKRKDGLRNVKFYLISQRGREFLQDAKSYVQETKEVKNDERREE